MNQAAGYRCLGYDSESRILGARQFPHIQYRRKPICTDLLRDLNI